MSREGYPEAAGHPSAATERACEASRALVSAPSQGRLPPPTAVHRLWRGGAYTPPHPLDVRQRRAATKFRRSQRRPLYRAATEAASTMPEPQPNPPRPGTLRPGCAAAGATQCSATAVTESAQRHPQSAGNHRPSGAVPSAKSGQPSPHPAVAPQLRTRGAATPNPTRKNTRRDDDARPTTNSS